MSKRFLFITPLFPKYHKEDTMVPFITHFTQQFANQKDVQIDIISLMFPKTKPYQFEKNITVYPIGSGFLRFHKLLPFFIKAIAKGIQLFRENKYDGILCFWYRECSLIGKVLSFLFKKKQIVWMLGQDIKKDNKYIPLLKISPENIIMMSAQQRDLFYENQNIKINTIANVAIDRNRFPKFNYDTRNIDILGVGNLGALKNYSLFVEIISELKILFPNIKTTICGEGEEKEMLLKKVISLGLEENIVFSGSISHKEILNYMNNATVFLHTSKSEGGGTVLQEALYSGCKIISTISIEENNTFDSFYFSTKKENLISKIKSILKNPTDAIRIENFKMEDTVNVIYDALLR